MGKRSWKVSAVAELLTLEELNLREGEYALRPVSRERAEKAERERDAAVKDLKARAIEGYTECQYCLYRNARSFCWGCVDGSSWQWRGIWEGKI